MLHINTVYVHTSMPMSVAFYINVYDLIGQYYSAHMYILTIICWSENIQLLLLQRISAVLHASFSDFVNVLGLVLLSQASS